MTLNIVRRLIPDWDTTYGPPGDGPFPAVMILHGSEGAWSWRGSSETLLPTTPIEVERYAGPVFLSHGTADRVWSVEMTRRLEARLRAHGPTPEVHYYEGEDHIPRSETENEHHAHLVDFFERHLRS